MSRSATIRWEFGGVERLFRLTIERLEDLQEGKCDAGPSHIWALLDTGQWKSWHVIEPLVQGLRGGEGIAESAARKLVKKEVAANGLGDYVDLAKAVCAASVTGTPDEAPKGFGETARQETSRFPTENSGSPRSTDGAVPSASMSVQ